MADMERTPLLAGGENRGAINAPVAGPAVNHNHESVRIVGPSNQRLKRKPSMKVRDLHLYRDWTPMCVAAGLILAYMAIGCLYYGAFVAALEGDSVRKGHPAGFVNAFYFTCVSLTSVGYGDFRPESTSSKLVTCLFAFYGVGVVGYCIGMVFSKLLDHQDEKEEIALRNSVLSNPNFRADGYKEDVTVLEQVYTTYRSLPNAVESLVQILAVVAVGVGLAYLDAHLSGEHVSFVEAFYFACISVTTIGFGDRTWTSTTGKVLGALFLLFSTLVFANAVSTVADIPLERRRKKLERRVLLQYGDVIRTKEDLMELVVDSRGGVDRSDFILRLLLKLDLVTAADVIECGHRFDLLDVTDDNRLTEADVRSLAHWTDIKHMFKVLHGPRTNIKKVRFEHAAPEHAVVAQQERFLDLLKHAETPAPKPPS